MIILTLVDGYEEIFVTFHQLKSCRSTTRYHSVLDIKRVHNPHPLMLGNCCLRCFFICFADRRWILLTTLARRFGVFLSS